MKASEVLVVAGLSLAATVASAEPRVITNPDWISRPSGALLAQHYPMLASMMEIEGKAQITCHVTEEGLLKACKVDSEDPPGFGFGAAAIATSSTFRMKPQTIDGQPVGDAVVCIPLRFVLPPSPPPPAAAPPLPSTITEQTRTAALRIVGPGAAQIHAEYDAQIVRLLANSKADADQATRQAAASALRASVARHADGLRQGMADAFLATLTPAEIHAIDAFEAAARSAPKDQLRDFNPDLQKRMSAHMYVELRTEYCRANACQGTPAEMAAVAAAAGDGVLEVERWKATPPTKFSSPLAADVLGVSGAVRLTCEAQADGALKNCVVAAEAPAKWGFGRSALGLARGYRLEALAEGATSSPQLVTVRIALPPQPRNVEPPPAPQSAASYAAARKLLAAVTRNAGYREQAPMIVTSLTRRLDPTLIPSVESAVRAAVPRAVDRMLEDVASILASEYSEAQLAPMVAFLSSPIGMSANAKAAILEEPVSAAVRRHQAMVAAEAWGTFCADRKCPTGGPSAATAADPEHSTRQP